MLRLYTDESPGLKVDPMVILFLSLGFIFSVVSLHRKSFCARKSRTEIRYGSSEAQLSTSDLDSYTERELIFTLTVIAKLTKRFS